MRMSTVHAADENQQIKCYGRHHRLLEVQGVAVDVAKKACNIIKEHPNDDVKEEACKCLPNLIVAVKT